MWFERFVIVGTTLGQDFLPSSWGHYTPSWVEVFTFIGTHGMFVTLFLVFMRFLPMIAISEVKAVKREADPHHDSSAGDHQHGESPILVPSKEATTVH
jgi:molybdopterin-containing oxidoreductase family membrane subunit